MTEFRFKQVIIARKDLGLSPGKLAAQVAHASVSAADKSKWKKQWLMEGQKKSVLKVDNLRELIDIFMKARDSGLSAELVQDMGKTEIPAGTKTCVGIGPAPEKEIDRVTGELKLY